MYINKIKKALRLSPAQEDHWLNPKAMLVRVDFQNPSEMRFFLYKPLVCRVPDMIHLGF